MKIVREPLADKGRKQKIAGYSRITWAIAQQFAQKAAQDEANQRKDVRSVSAHNRENDGKITTEFTLLGHQNESLVKFYAVP